MSKTSQWLTATLLLGLALSARAGDIYTCKGAHGENVYQSTPCPAPDKQVDHRRYDPAMARAADGSAGATERIYTSSPNSYSQQMGVADGYRRGGGVSYGNGSPPVAGEQPASPPPSTGYRCAAGNRTWVQPAPCPATYASSNFVGVEGHLMDGTPVRGTAFMPVDKPVEQQQLDRDALCEQVRSGARVGQAGGSDASQAYERNKLKRNLCGG